MDIIPLAVAPKNTDITPRAMRREGVVPCVVYGNEVANTAFSVEHNELYRVYAKAGESTLVELDIEGKKIPVLFHQLQFDPVSDKITHVDFYAVNMKKEVDASIPVHFEGDAPAVDEKGGILVTSHDHVTVTCLPTNLPHSLQVDISSMVEFGDQVTVADIKVPSGVTIMDDTETVLASVQEPRKEEVEEAPAEGEGAEKAAAEGGSEGEEKKEEASE